MLVRVMSLLTSHHSVTSWQYKQTLDISKVLLLGSLTRAGVKSTPFKDQLVGGCCLVVTSPAISSVVTMGTLRDVDLVIVGRDTVV